MRYKRDLTILVRFSSKVLDEENIPWPLLIVVGVIRAPGGMHQASGTIDSISVHTPFIA